MNYLLKRQPPPCSLTDCLLINTKHSSRKYYFCGNCLRLCPVYGNNVQQCRNSNYISALRILQDKKRTIKRNENVSKRVGLINDNKKLTEMLKIVPPKASTRKYVNLKKNFLGKTLGWKNKCNIDCTNSYDPNMLNFNPALEHCYKPFSQTSEQNFNYMKDSEEERSVNNVFKAVDSSLVSSYLKENKNFYGKTVKTMDIKQKPLGEHRNIEAALNKMNINKENILGKLTDTKELSKRDFEKITVSEGPDTRYLLFLHSSIDVCITNSMVKEAYNLFLNSRGKAVWRSIIVNNHKMVPDVYNSLLYALSSKGYWYLMLKVTKWMEEDRVKLNSESFAALFNCLAKCKELGNDEFVLKEATKILNLIFANNISLNDIICKTRLPKEVVEKVLATIREVVPSFEIKPEVIELSSDCTLLRGLHLGPSNLQPQVEGLSIQELEHLVEEQLLVEKNFYLGVKAVSRGFPGEIPFKDKQRIENLKILWREALTNAVFALRKVHRTEFPMSPKSYNLHIYLTSLPVYKIVDILMETTQSLVEYSGVFSPSCSYFHKSIGNKVYKCYQLRKKDQMGITDTVEKLHKKYVSWYLNPSGPAMNSRQKWQMIIQDNQVDADVIKWPKEVIVKLGKLLLDVIFKEVKVTVRTNAGLTTVPVMYTVMRYRDNVYKEEIKCHPIVADLYRSVGFDILHFPSNEIPMVCPPKPWKAPDHGGCLFIPTDFIRRPGGVQGKTIRLKDVPVKQLYPIFDSLNALQMVSWKINEEVLDVALEVFTAGGSKELNVPLFPEKVPPRERLSSELTYKEIKNMYQQRMELVRSIGNNYALWCEALYRLSLANHFRKKIFWMPQNCDFRGRVYPVPPLINHLGSDLFRSLLLFAKGKPLGPKGLDWLKIHLINLTGTHKKRPVRERLAYANEILPVILDSAEKPLTGNKWWTESDEPWQTLGACMELKKAISHPNPEEYVCRFPIHQDGSCNGLQHYAALGKDLIGAKSVNLAPSDTPQDVYAVVAQLIEEERVKDVEKGIEIAKILEGFIERKVVKQTVMTTVYGVTMYGAKLQISKRLEEIPNFPQEHVKRAAVYLSDKTFFCLRKMFTSAKEIQEWFINCAKEICMRNDYVQWISPLGLPVVQSYGKMSERGVNIWPDTMKQKNAFPPNFIHSLDSCHMMLTSIYCEQFGLTFAAVHDCFWTHACNVDLMNRICREQFVSLHSQPILEELSQFFKMTYLRGSTCKEETLKIFEAVPKKGTFDIREVMNSVYFFS